MQNIENTQTNTIITKLISVVAIAALAAGAFFLQQNRKKENTAAQPVSSAPETTTKQISYKNGTYSVTGNYVSPGGPESVGVKLTLTDNMVTDVEFTPHAERPMSQKMQADFAANFKPFVIGKSIDEINLTKVSGSSLTPKGFNDAISKIKVEARI